MERKVFYITKIINNNIVCSKDENGEEIILRGLGIGFGKRKKDAIEAEKVEKIYKMENKSASGKLQELLQDLPIEYVNVTTDIIEYAKQKLGKQLSENIYITLTDHISFAIERKSKKLEYKNAMLTEIRNFYQEEYLIGKEALQMIYHQLGIELSLDEAGFIALHIVNAELNLEMSNMVNITELIHNILEIVRNYYGMELDEESLHFDRFVTHLKFFGQRLFKNEITKDNDIGFQEMVKVRYKNDYDCAAFIREHVEKKYGKQISEEEMMFLTVHLNRVSRY